jgi:hypothetical protein
MGHLSKRFRVKRLPINQSKCQAAYRMPETQPNSWTLELHDD